MQHALSTPGACGSSVCGPFAHERGRLHAAYVFAMSTDYIGSRTQHNSCCMRHGHPPLSLRDEDTHAARSMANMHEDPFPMCICLTCMCFPPSLFPSSFNSTVGWPTSSTLSTSQGSKYNIPILVWVLEHYPLQAPLVYVVPTNDMVIKASHPFVDSSGQVCGGRGVGGGPIRGNQ